MAFLANSTFESGLGDWRAVNGANLVTTQIIRDGTARSGDAFLRTKSDEFGGSVATDFGLLQSSSGEYPDVYQWASTRSVAAFAYLRAGAGSVQVEGQLKLWSLGLENRVENTNGTNFTVGQEWTLVMCCLDGTGYQYIRYLNRYQPPIIRLEFYINTVGAYLDIDTVNAF